jgi:1,2-diacylglycerol 3-beta-glucosyltransferase
VTGDDPGERRGAQGRPEGEVGTPAGWRVAAVVVLLAGLAAGWWVATAPIGWVVAAAIAGGAFVFAAGTAFAGRHAPILGPRSEPAPQHLPTLSVLIPVRDEAAVIGRLIGDLARQDHRGPDDRPAFEVIVIDDRSTDGTAGAAEAAAEQAGVAPLVRVLRRAGSNLPDGKGAALTLAQPDQCRGEGVVVLDGDARIGPAFLRTLAGYLGAGAVAVTARRRTSLEAATWLTRAQAVEQAQDGAIQRGRSASGGCSELRGNGMTIRRNALAAVGGWRAEELTEDLDLSSRLAARLGVTVAWAIEAVVTEEPVHHWRALWRQRLRWAEGGVRRAFEHGPEVVRSPLLPIRAKLDFATYVAQVAAAPVIVGAVAGAAATGILAATGIVLAGYFASSALLAWVGLAREAAVDGATVGAVARTSGAIRASLFGFLWLATIPAAFARLAGRRGALTFAKTARTSPSPGPTAGEPEPLVRPR